MGNTCHEQSALLSWDYKLVLAVIKVESNFKHDAVSNRVAAVSRR